MGSTHVVEQLSFSLFLSILTFDFDSIFGSFLTFWGPNGLILGLGKGPNTVLGSTHIRAMFSVLEALGQGLCVGGPWDISIYIKYGVSMCICPSVSM